MQRSALSEGFLHRGLLAMLSPNGLAYWDARLIGFGLTGLARRIF